MPLRVGEKIGHFEVLSLLGQGGMGEVYRARDTKLKRDVALKVLPEAFARDPERMARFQREAEVLASLNHTNIAQIYGVEERALAMELVEGEAPKGPLPFDDAWKIASQIAAALEYAHDKGIIHRDLKPANIKVTPDGTVKLLDFGLAKAFSNQREPSVGAENSPTLTLGATEVGVILGTAAYMAPEQARGKAVDKRADIWSFGVVLYELLTGERVFTGEDAAETLAAVIHKQPDLAKVPPQARRLLEDCLQKDPRQRLRDIGDAKRFVGESAAVVAVTPVARLGKLPWIAAGVMTVASIALSILYSRASNTTAPETRVDIVTPPTTLPGSFALSPDGRKIAYVATSEGASRLWVRPLDSISAQLLPGTENARYPFWSPDSRSLGFFADRNLKRIDLGGGQPQTLADASTIGSRGAWSANGAILFNSVGPLLRIPAAGGQAVTATKLGKGESAHRSPQFLTGGRRFIFASTGPESAIWLGSLDAKSASPEPRRIATLAPGTESPGEYLAPGWLVRVRQNVLVAQRFDAASCQFSGDPITLAQTVGIDPVTGAGTFSVSPSGTIAWRNSATRPRQLIWFNRSGQSVGVFGVSDDSNLGQPELSPDGKRVAVFRGNTGSRDIWMQEATRTSRFTFDPADDLSNVWSPDGARVVFASNRKGTFDLYQKPADGSGSEELLLQSADSKRPNSWSPDGRFILYGSSQNNGDLMVLPLSGDRKPFPFLSTPFNEVQGVFSPDGKWVAYQSNESGRFEVYVRPFPGPGGQWQVSTGGGISPRWRADGKELYYLAPDNKLMAVAASATSGTFVPGTPEALFQTHTSEGNTRQQYDVARDGRFLISTDLQDASIEPIHLLMNWKPPAK